MKKYGKALICLLVCCLLGCFLLAGCTGGGTNDPSSVPEEEQSSMDPSSQEPEPGPSEPREIEALSPADNGTAVLANEKVAAFVRDFEVCGSADYTDGTDMYANLPLELTWTCEREAESYVVRLSRAEDLSGAAEYQTAGESLTVENLFTATEYFWQVEAETADGPLVSDVFRFTTAATPRTVFIEGVSNTRDIGGYRTADGKQVRQGMIYRGGKLEDITEAGRETLLQTLGVRTDLDLRGDDPVNVLGDAVQYIQVSAPSYTTPNDPDGSGINAVRNREAIAAMFRVLADEENYPVYVHCAIGRDRTGTFALLLGMLLGVEQDGLFLDYEMSLFSAAGCSDNTPIDTLFDNFLWPTYTYIENYGKGSAAQNCEQFLKDAGLTAEEIASIRSILLV